MLTDSPREIQYRGTFEPAYQRVEISKEIDAAPAASVILMFESCSPDLTVVQFAAASIFAAGVFALVFGDPPVVIDCRYQ